MSKTLTSLGVTAVAMCLSGGLAAQGDIGIAARQANLQALAERLQQRDEIGRNQAQAYAQSQGIPLRRNLPGGRVLELLRIEPGSGPVFYITNNVDAADSVSTDEVWPGGMAGLNLDGAGMVIGHWDAGAVESTHTDLIGRVLQADGATTISGHATHTAGTLIGSGAGYPFAQGMAYGADLETHDWISDTAEMATAAAAGAILSSNHSYGIATGWLYIGDLPPDTWWWIGGPGDEDPNFGYYDAEAQAWDQIAYNAPHFLIVKAAGNDRTDVGPTSPGEYPYTIVDQDGAPLGTSNTPRPADCAPLGFDCLPGHSVAKNILTVGAVDDVAGGYNPVAGPGQVVMTDFSSWGPTDDGRIKPDLVGNGMFLISTYPTDTYAAAAGTSMAAPNVTGSLILLQQHYENLNGANNNLSAAALKALAIHTADEAGEFDGPDYVFGWGLLNTMKAAEVITEDGGGDHYIFEGSLSNGGVDNHAINVANADSTITATLVWMDPPGTPAPPSLDPADLMLVNDLDLRVIDGPATHMPWVLDPSNPGAAATKGDNFRDNVEQVEVTGAAAGGYTVRVSHKGSLLGGASQDYALIVSITPVPPSGSGLLIEENFSGGLPAGWSIVTNPGGIPWVIAAPVPGDSRLDNNTTGSGNFALVANLYANETVTSLRTPSLDLSSNTGAVLRFREWSNYDTFETFNVDVSTDGGSVWTNAWTRMGYKFIPGQVTVDLSSLVAGEANVMIRFRFDSMGWLSGDVWQVDNIELEGFGGAPTGDPPGQASAPSPADAATDVDINADLAWTAGSLATSHDVYFGTDATPDASESQGNQAGTSYEPGTLAWSTTYYWRIDEVNGDGTTPGPIWSFTTEAEPLNPPGQASAPSPADAAADVDINADLAWTAGSLATSHDVYFGTDSTPDAGEAQGNQAGTAFEPGTLAWSTTYYWRIDEVNDDGTTAGPVWSFTTEADPTPPPPPETMHLAGLGGWATPGSRNRWNATVEILVEDQDNGPEQGVTVDGDWSNGANGGASCVTNSAGVCTVTKNNLKSNVASAAFTVNSLTKTGINYEPADNVGGDGITVNQTDTNSDLTPSASNDSYETAVDTPLNGNVIDNDDPGNGPASINSNTLPSNGSLSLSGEGSFTYTPDPGYEGGDSFTYDIIDQDGDVSNTATVDLTVTAAPPPPPPPGGRSVSASPYKVKGIQHVALTWQNFSGATVEITRNTDPLEGNSPTANDGQHDDNIGVKGGGQTYLYEVCETGTSNCANASASF